MFAVYYLSCFAEYVAEYHHTRRHRVCRLHRFQSQQVAHGSLRLHSHVVGCAAILLPVKLSINLPDCYPLSTSC
jgi:hypothetical protein